MDTHHLNDINIFLITSPARCNHEIEIQSVPTLVLYSKGEELKRKSGFMTVDELNVFAQEA
jgi:hypothetical protein